jgi:serine/threonine protein kinase
MDVGSIWNGWKVESLIGEGSFGKVYKVVREEFGYKYEAALKVITIPQTFSEVETIRNDGMTDENITVYFQGMVQEIVQEFTLMSMLTSSFFTPKSRHLHPNRPKMDTVPHLPCFESMLT